MDTQSKKNKVVLKPHLTKVTNFCIAITTLTRKQRVAVLNQLHKTQFHIIREISLNILINKSLSLTETEKRYFNHNLNKLKILGSRTSSKETKLKIITNNQQLIKKTALTSLKYLNKAQ